MKKLAILGFMVFFFFQCQNEKVIIKPSSTIFVKAPDTTLRTLEVTRPLNGILLWENKVDKISRSTDGHFSYKFEIDSPEYASLRIGNKYKTIILLPNQEYQIDLTNDEILYSKDNAQGQHLLNSFVRTPANSFTFINKFNQDTTAQQIRSKIKSLKEKEIEKVDSLLNSNLIDKSFSKALKKDIDYYYASGIVSISDYKSRTATDSLKVTYKSLIEKTEKIYPYTLKTTPKSWADYVMDLKIRGNIYGGQTSERLAELYKKDSLHYFVINRIKSNIDNPYQEKILAHYIFNEAKQLQYEKSLVAIFDSFKRDFPESEFIPYLEKELLPFRNYHIKSEYALSKNVTLVEDSTANSLKELLRKFEGEKLYIDIWATWCGPCKKEFIHNDKIGAILKKYDYKKLYVSVDKKEARDKWIEMIKFYDLAGYHHLANQDFFVDFEKNHSTLENSIAIPQYLIVSEKGEIITNSAPRPSSSNELEIKLKSLE